MSQGTARRHNSMQAIDSQMWGGAMPCQNQRVEDFFSILLEGAWRSLSKEYCGHLFAVKA